MKSMKKLVLAGLVLLASVMVLVGCKNDSVPEVPKYTVKFETEHGTAPASITVESGTKLTAEQLKALPDTVDNIFEGWYDGKTQAKGGEYTVTKDVTLVAGWRNRDTVASVTFDPPSTKFYYDETVTVTLTSADEGATIKYHLGDENWQTYSEEITVTSDTTITAYATKEGLKPSAESHATYTVRKLTTIRITPPTRTVYSVGDEFGLTGMVVTANYDDGKERLVEGSITSKTSSLTKSAGVKEIIVSYEEDDRTQTATFTVVVFPEEVKVLTDYKSPNNTDDSWTYVAFGEWPQSEAKNFAPQNQAISYGIFKENCYEEDDDKYVKLNGKYYKVEPIVWRVLNKNYSSTGQALLLAENILTGGIPYYSVCDVKRTIERVEISPNNYEHSQIRAFLNGLSYEYKESDSAEQTQKDEYKGIGFLQTAFTPGDQGLITNTIVDKSTASTTDKIFLIK